MNELEIIFNKIKEEKIDLSQFIDDYINGSENDNLYDTCFELLDYLRGIMKSNNELNLNEILKQYVSKEIASKLIEIVSNTLIHYIHFQPVRTLEIDHLMIMQMVIKDIFEHYMIRFDPNFIKQYNNYLFSSEEDLKNIIVTTEKLTMYYISYGFESAYVNDDFQNETGISDELVKTYTDCFELYYKELREEYIVSKLKFLQDSLIKQIN